MGWRDIDFLEVEKIIFSSEVEEVILPLYNASIEKLSAWRRQTEERFKNAISEAKTEDDETNARGQAVYEESRYDEQNQAIGSLALHHLCTALKVALTDATRFFKTTHPRSARAYSEKNWLARMQNEYGERFGIDFEKCAVPFANIEELVLARNAGLHWDAEATEEYAKKVSKPRFLDGGMVQVQPDQLRRGVDDAKQFVNWVIDQLKGLRTAKVSENSQ